MISSPKAAEFFAGIGLMRAGLEKAGWTVSFANDIDPVKQRLYRHQFQDEDNHFMLEDIHKLDTAQIPDIDLATASFPCTDLSLAGRRAGLSGEHSSAFWGFIQVLEGLGNRKPPLVLLENVAGFLTSNGGSDLQGALLALNALGYSVDAFLMDAIHFVPQSRVRFFIVGKLNDDGCKENPQFLTETQLRPKKLRDFIFNHPEIAWSVRLALPKLPERGHNLDDVVSPIAKAAPEWWNPERVNYLLNQVSERHLTKVMELREKPEYSYLTAFRRVRNGKSMAEIRFDGIAGCLRTPKGGSARQILLEVGKGEINVRLLSPVECGKLMGADDFRISGSTNEALFGFGDAVVVPVITWIAQNYLNPELEKRKPGAFSTPAYAKIA